MTARRALRIFVPHCSDLLTDHRPHGDGLVAYGFIRRLAERGHQVHAAVEQFDLLDSLHPNIELHAIRTRSGRPRNRPGYAMAVRRLFQRLSRERAFDVIHQLNPVFTGISLALVGGGVPVILGPFISRWPDDHVTASVIKAVGREVFRLAQLSIAGLQQYAADRLLLTTPAAASRLVCPSILKTRSEALPHGIDADLFAPMQEGELGRRARLNGGEILFMANVVRRKGILDLIAAFDLVAARQPHARLVVAGDGAQLEEAKSAASQSPACDRIVFLGAQSRADAVALFQKTDICCLPSHGEPYGMTAVEAMSCGKPLVVTDAGGLGCLVDDQGGIRVPVGAPAKLAEALCDLLAAPERCRAMGVHNRQRVLETMTWDRVIDRLEDIYLSTIAEKHGQGARSAPASTVPMPPREDCA